MAKSFRLLVISFLIISIYSPLISQVDIWGNKKSETQLTAEQKSHEYNMKQAFEAYNAGNLDKTKYHLNQAEKDNWTSTGFYYLLGLWAYDSGDKEGAKRYWLRGYKKRSCWDCKELADKVERGELITESKNSKLSTNNDNTAESYYNNGLVYYKNGDLKNALSSFTSCTNLDQNHANGYYLRSLVKIDMGDLFGAISDYDHIINNNLGTKLTTTNLATVYNNKAYALVQLNMLDEALPVVNKALELDENKGYIWGTRGEIYYNKKQYDLSITDFDKFISLQSTGIAAGNAYYYRGLCKLQLDNKIDGCMDLSKSNELGYPKALEAINMFCK